MTDEDDAGALGAPDPWLGDRTWLAVLAAGLLTIWLLGLASVELAPPGTQVAAWWPAAGVAVALALWTRPQLRWATALGILVASAAANLAGGRDLDLSLAYGVANSLEAATVAWWLGRRVPGPPRLRTLRDLWRLIAGTVLGALVAGVVAGLSVLLLTSGDVLTTGRAVVASHAAAVLTLCPLLMLPAAPPLRIPRVEAVLQPVLLTAVVLAVYLEQDGLPLSFLPMPVLAWGAARFGVRVAAAQLLAAGVVTSLLTTSGRGPFPAAVERLGLAPEVTGTLLQFELIASALVALPIALLTAEAAASVERARSSALLLESVMDAANRTAIVGTDLGSTVTFFNTGAENLLGWTAAEVVGRQTPEIWHDAEEVAARAEELGLPAGMGVVGATLEWGASSELRDWIWWARDGRRMTVSLRVTRRYDARGRCVGYLGVAEDVTEARRTEEVLRTALDREREAVQRLAQLDQTKSDFVASVSHELRTPITSVMGNLELALDGDAGELAPEQRALLERVDRNARRLLGLIEDLLTLSRVEAGTFRVRIRTTDLRDVVAHALESLEAARAPVDVRLEVTVPEEPVLVEGDPDQLERAVANLVSNALKFTPAGGRVSLALTGRAECAEVRVRDTGVGILPGDRPQVFERFFRSDAAIRSAVPGTGLGLSIVRAIVTGHGGEVDVDSTPGEGSTFTVRLPRRAPAPGPALSGAGPG